ncbi:MULTISPECIES: PKD domain-containing protein [Chitinophagaceae]
MHKKLALVIASLFLHVIVFCQTPSFDILVGNEKISTGCVGVTITLKNTSIDTSHVFHWNINGYRINTTSTFFIFLKEGTYPIQLTDEQNSLTFTRNIIINPLPTASFNASQNNICVGNTIGFTSTSKGVTTIQTYYWNFEDEAVISNNATTNYTFNKTGTKKVLLFVKDANGCYSPTSAPTQITVNGNANASFTTDNGQFYSCGNTVSFSNTSEIQGLTYNWSFGDGNTFTGTTSPTHTYDKPGTYTISITSNEQNNSSCTSKFSHIVYVGKPKLSITTVDSICSNVAFNIAASDLSNTIDLNSSDYSWSTTNGNFVSDSTALSYPTTGIYELTVINKKGCPSPTSKQIKVNQTPNVTLNASPNASLCKIIPITFTATTDQDASLRWVLGDGTIRSTQHQDTIVHSYSNAGTYNTYVEATNTAGCSMTSTIQTVSVTDNCIDNGTDTLLNPIFKFTSDCENKYLVTFEDRNVKKQLESISIDGTIYPFTDGSIKVQLPFKGKGAIYHVLVKYADGTYDNARDITIMDETADFTVKNNDNSSMNCAQNNYTFSAVGLVNSNNISKYVWSIIDTEKDSVIFQAASPILSSLHYFIPYATTYKVRLTVFDKRSNPCISDTSKTFTVYGSSGNFTSASDSIFCEPHASVVLTNLSSIDSSKYLSMTWNWGDGTVSTYNNNIPDTIQHNYNYTGSESAVSYDINLKISDRDGCTSNITINSKYKLYNAQLSGVPKDAILCNSNTITILNQSSITDLHTDGFQWQVGDITQNTNGNNAFSAPINTTEYPAYYDVKITATYGKGINCQKDTTYKSLIKFIKPKAAFTITDSDQLNICPPYILHLKNESTGYKSLQWTLSDSINNTSLKDTILYYIEKPNYYSIKLKLNGYDNCYDSVTYTFVSKGPKATLTSSTYLGCVPETTNLQLHSTDPIENYLWAFGDSNTLSSPNAANVSHQYTNSGIYTPSVTIIGTEESGHCFNNLELTTPIVVDEKINLQYKTPYSYCLGDSVNGGLQLQALSHMTDSYTWTTNSGTANTIVTDPTKSAIMVKPLATATYTVVAHSHNTCPDETASITVDTHESPEVHFNEHDITLSAGTTFNPNPIIRSSYSNLKYLWAPSYRVSDPYTSNPQIMADNNVVYTLKATNTFGCSALDSLHIKTLCASAKIFIPSAFTPNSDGKNDVFYIKGYGIQLVNHFLVVDRWGKIVFEKNNIAANDISQGWTGYVNNTLAAPGTYVYYADITCTEGNKFQSKGTVVLIR